MAPVSEACLMGIRHWDG